MPKTLEPGSDQWLISLADDLDRYKQHADKRLAGAIESLLEAQKATEQTAYLDAATITRTVAWALESIAKDLDRVAHTAERYRTRRPITV